MPTKDFTFQEWRWQQEAAAKVEEAHRDFQVQTLHHGTCLDTCSRLCRVAWPSQRFRPVLSRRSTPLFRVLLLRRLHLHLYVAIHLTHVDAIVQLTPGLECWEAWCIVESAAAQICREAGARVATNVSLIAAGSCRRWFVAPR